MGRVERLWERISGLLKKLGRPDKRAREALPLGYRFGSYVIDAQLEEARLGRLYVAHRVEFAQGAVVYILHADVGVQARTLFCGRARQAYQWGLGQAQQPMLDLCDHDGVLAVVFVRNMSTARIVNLMEGSG